MNRKNTHYYRTCAMLMILTAYHIAGFSVFGQDIRPYQTNPWYWEYHGEPVFLRGASDNDNLFQWTGRELTDQLDLLVSVGGNYVRNTMSDRDEDNVFAYKATGDGKYDLSQWNQEYWDRLEFFLKETEKRNIIVQLTLWDQYDLHGRFHIHPLNPDNNINLEAGAIQNARDYYEHSLDDGKEEVLAVQENFVRKLVSETFPYGHVLYNIANETVSGREWQNHWAGFLKREAREAGKEIHITSMNMAPSTGVRNVIQYPDLYTYADISQNNQDFCGGTGKVHYENILYWRELIAMQKDGPMPLNNVKIYGGGHYNAGTPREAEERFWRNIFAGAASVRFHRPADGVWGIGLSERAQINLRALSEFLEEFDIVRSAPYPACEPVGYNPAAYALAVLGEKYAVYFPGGRYGVKFDPLVYVDRLKIRWLNIETGEWEKEERVSMDWSIDDISRLHGYRNEITLWTPGSEPYLALIEPAE